MPNRTFIRWNNYQTKKHKLEQELKDIKDQEKQEIPDNALAAFDKFFTLTEHHYPLLLSVGDPLTLQQNPSAIYLLPKVAGINNRILVVQMPKKPGGDARLELYEWQPSKAIPEPPYERQDAQIKPWNSSNDSKQPFSIKIEDTDFDLNERPLRISAINLSGAMLIFDLEFKQGKLIVAAPPKQENATASWVDLPQDRDIVQVERTSADDMPAIIHYRRGLKGGLGWQDDDILLPDGTSISTQEPIGRIKGADGSLEDRICFIASNGGRVIQLDFNPQAGSNNVRIATIQGHTQESKDTFGGHIEDVVMLPKQGGTHRALAPCYNGKLYAIEACAEGIKVVAEQRAERLHISRITANSDGEILAMDQHHRLCTLRLNDYRAHDGLARNAIRTLSTLSPLKGSNAQLEESNKQFPIYCEVLMHAWLDNLEAEDNPFKDKLFDAIQTLKAKLAEAGLTAAERQETAKHYYSLLKILHKSADGWFYKSLANARDRHEIIQQVFSWLELQENTPDWLWLKLFREWDRIEYAIDNIPSIEPKTYAKQLASLRQFVYQKRRQFAQQAQKLRPITAIASTRLPGLARHIRRLGQSPQGNQRFVCAAYAHGLFAYQLIQKDNDAYFEQLAHCDGKQQGEPRWQGRIRTIATEIQGYKPNDSLLFIATHRGECHLLELNNNKFIEIRKTDIPLELECATSRFVAYKAGNKTKRGFLVAGSAPDEKASIYWLELQRNNQFIAREIYRSDIKGRIRMLAHATERQKNLWGIDEEQGLLLHWGLDLLETESTSNQLKNKTTLYHSGETLHSLYLTKDQEQPQIVCASHDGMATAFCAQKANHGQLIWNAGCGIAIRRLREIRTSKGSLFVLAGDAQHVLLYDQYGRLTGMVENVGPVSAMGTLKKNGEDDILLLGAKSGRLIGLSLNTILPIQVNHKLPDDPIAYALRQPAKKWQESEIEQLLRSGESLLFQQGLV